MLENPDYPGLRVAVDYRLTAEVTDDWEIRAHAVSDRWVCDDGVFRAMGPDAVSGFVEAWQKTRPNADVMVDSCYLLESAGSIDYYVVEATRGKDGRFDSPMLGSSAIFEFDQVTGDWTPGSFE